MVDVSPMQSGHVASVADLHIASLPDDFLPSLGRDFLRTLYQGLLTLPLTVSLVAIEDVGVAGFVVGTLDTQRMFTQLLRRKGMLLTLHVLRRIPSRPSLPLRALEALTYPRKQHAELPAAELVALAVGPASRGRGIGKTLVARLNEEFRPRGVSAYRVTTAADNAGADAFYRRLGFRLEHTFLMHRRPFHCYTYHLA